MSKKKEFKTEKVSRTAMVKILNETKGRLFTSTHIGKDGEEHAITGMRMKDQNNDLGYIQVKSMKVKEPRLINPQTLKTLRVNGIHYELKK